jgi:hypothetical protein
VSSSPLIPARATLTIAATALVFDVLWKEPEEDQAVAALCRDDTPHEQRKPDCLAVRG